MAYEEFLDKLKKFNRLTLFTFKILYF